MRPSTSVSWYSELVKLVLSRQRGEQPAHTHTRHVSYLVKAALITRSFCSALLAGSLHYSLESNWQRTYSSAAYCGA